MKLNFVNYIIIILSFLVGFFGVFLISDVNPLFCDEIENTVEEQKQYYGPVPEGYDESHYHKTGELILLNG